MGNGHRFHKPVPCPAESPIMNNNRNDDSLPTTTLIPVHFAFTHPTAVTVSVAGSFNEWHPTTKAMHPAGDGGWVKEAFLPPGDYEYCLVVDGQWISDPRAADVVPNPFGGRNSVLKVTRSARAARRMATPNLPLQTQTQTALEKL